MKILKLRHGPGSLEFFCLTTIFVLSADEIGATAWISLSSSSGKLLLRTSAIRDWMTLNPGDLCLISTQFVDTEPLIEFVITSNLAIDLYVDYMCLTEWLYNDADITRFQIEIT